MKKYPTPDDVERAVEHGLGTHARREPFHERVARRAYERFQLRGSEHGHDQQDWFEAERELRASDTYASSSTPNKSKMVRLDESGTTVTGPRMSDQESSRGQGISNRESPQEEAAERAQYPPIQEGAPDDATDDVREDLADVSSNRQTSQKVGTRSSGQKDETTRHTDRPAPSTHKVQGAFGREGQA